MPALPCSALLPAPPQPATFLRCSSYVPEPKTFLHHASAEAKQLWMVAVLVAVSGAGAPPVRTAAAALLLLATVAALPRRLWEPQLRRLGGLCALMFVFTAIGKRGWVWAGGLAAWSAAFSHFAFSKELIRWE